MATYLCVVEVVAELQLSYARSAVSAVGRHGTYLKQQPEKVPNPTKQEGAMHKFDRDRFPQRLPAG